jgi:hypothetical protein
LRCGVVNDFTVSVAYASVNTDWITRNVLKRRLFPRKAASPPSGTKNLSLGQLTFVFTKRRVAVVSMVQQGNCRRVMVED